MYRSRGFVSFLKALSLGYYFLHTPPVWWKIWTVLQTVEGSTFRWLPISLYESPSTSFCHTMRHLRSSLYALVRLGSQDILRNTGTTSNFAVIDCACANIDFARSSEITVYDKSTGHFSLRGKRACVWMWTTWLATILFLGELETFFASSIIDHWQ